MDNVSREKIARFHLSIKMESVPARVCRRFRIFCLKKIKNLTKNKNMVKYKICEAGKTNRQKI